MSFGKFKKPTPAGKPSKKKSRYAGVKSAAPRDPIPHVGVYRFRVLSIELGHNPGKDSTSHKTTFEIVNLDEVAERSHKVGDTCMIPHRVGGAGASSGMPRCKAEIMAEAGFEDEDEYDKFDPDGEFIDSTEGEKNDYLERFTLIGRLVDCQVTRGNATDDGNDYYREYAWAVVPDGEQDQVPCVLEQAAP